MFMTPGLALFLIALKFFLGALVGLGTVALAYRTRFLRGAAFGGVMFVLASGLAGWAGSHSAFVNGRRVDIAPSGENLWLRNRIVENETVICVVSACGAALLTGVKVKSSKQPT